MNSLALFLSLLPVGSMGLGHMPPYMTPFLISVKHALLLLSLEAVVCSTPAVHLHNCKVYFVKHTQGLQWTLAKKTKKTLTLEKNRSITT